MTPDSPTPNPHDEAPPSRVFDETRPSTLARNIPTTEAEMPDALRDEVSQTQPIVDPNNVPEVAIDTEVIDAKAATQPGAIAPELLDEFAASQAQTPDATEPEPKPKPAADPALALTFSPAPNAPFQSSVTVGISCLTSDANIFYTLDGSEPTQNSTAYDKDKILLTQSATLSARAYASEQSGAINKAEYTVNKPLWQENEPADSTDPTPHKISENQSASDGWQMAAASVRGKLHAHRALWREDAFALGKIGEWSAVLVSDGAGSAPLSRVGANLACQSALGNLNHTLGEIETLNDDINAELPRIKAALISAATAALQAIRDEADKRSQPANAFAATLLILVRRAYHDKQLCAAIQVGDGAIALDCASGLKLLGAADHGQHSSETRFLTTNGMEADFTNRVKFSLPADLRATLVVSDGVSDDYFPEDKRLTEVFEAVQPLIQNADDAGAALLGWLGYEKKGSSDDRTLVLSWPGAAIGEADNADDNGDSEGVEFAPSSNRDEEESDAMATVSDVEADAPGAGLPPSSNLEVAPETRLEEGGSPALLLPTSNSEVNPQPRLEEGGSPALPTPPSNPQVNPETQLEAGGNPAPTQQSDATETPDGV